MLKEFHIFKVKNLNILNITGSSLNKRLVSFSQYKTPADFANFL